MPIVECKKCNKEFYVKPSHQKLGFGKFCSRSCHNLGQRTGKFVSCFFCGTKTWKTPKAINGSKSGKLFCSKTCQTIWRNTHYSGNLHPNWKDGSCKNYRKIIENSKKPKRCLLCGCHDYRVLAVHHVNKDRCDNDIHNLV